MKWGGRRNMRLNHAIFWILAAPMLSSAADEIKDEFSFRKRVAAQEGSASEVVVTEKGYQTDGRLVNNVGDELLENLWAVASVGAQFERGPKRGLNTHQYPYFSMPTSPARPSQPSRPNPTPSPPARTPAPVDDPTGPTPSTPVAPLPTTPISQPTAVPGVEPACLMGRTRDEFFFDLLVPITSGRLLNDPSTPQGQAYDFLANQDAFLEDPCQSTTIDQRFGLVTLFYSTGGDDWSNNSGWLGEDQECSWSGVTCSTTSERARLLQLCKLSPCLRHVTQRKGFSLTSFVFSTFLQSQQQHDWVTSE
jgi:hypothetical protein